MTMAVRPSPIAGQWYEADPTLLARQVDAFMAAAELPVLVGEVVAVVAPHAGHRYSGAVAGHAFAALRGGRYECVAVVSPMHQPRPEPLITSAHRLYATPLGEIPVDLDAVARLDSELLTELGHGLAFLANDSEHSLEIELPFLQRALAPGWRLLPVMVRNVEPTVSEKLGAALARTLHGRKAIIVASTDLSHFYDQATATSLDQAMLREIERFSPEGAYEVERAGRGFACGLGALAAVLWAARALGANEVRILRHATSGEITGDLSSVVGYGAAAVLRRGPGTD
jgi:hypothetical protein